MADMSSPGRLQKFFHPGRTLFRLPSGTDNSSGFGCQKRQKKFLKITTKLTYILREQADLRAKCSLPTPDLRERSIGLVQRSES